MTITQIAELAIARALEFGAREPISREGLFRRIGYRQQRLFSLANKANPDFFGTSAVVTLSSGVADLEDIPLADGDGDALYEIEQVEKVTVENKGSSSLTNGDEVHLVPWDDTGVTDAPRVTLRDNLLSQVGTDLTNVTSLRIHYARLPHAVNPLTDANVEAQLPEMWQDLLVVDGAKHVLRASGDAALVSRLDAEEVEMLEGFVAHVKRAGSGAKARFGVRSREAVP